MGVANMKCLIPGSRVSFVYKNWKGNTSRRLCIVESIGFGRSEYHGETMQWFLNGYDLDKGARRSYALVDIQLTDFGDPNHD